MTVTRCDHVVGGAVAFTPPRWRAPAWLVLLFVGAAVGAALELPSSWSVVWAFDYLLGGVVGLTLLERLPRRGGDRRRGPTRARR